MNLNNLSNHLNSFYSCFKISTAKKIERDNERRERMCVREKERERERERERE